MITVQRISPITGKTNEMEIDLPYEEYERGKDQFDRGISSQYAFPSLTAKEHAFITVGIYPGDIQ